MNIINNKREKKKTNCSLLNFSFSNFPFLKPSILFICWLSSKYSPTKLSFEW